MCQPDRVAGDLARVFRAEPQTDERAGFAETGEELLLGARRGRRGANLAAQCDPRRFLPAAPGCLLRLGAGRAARGGAIRRGGLLQSEAPLRCLAGFSYPVEVIPDLRPDAVLPGQCRDDMNVIWRMPDRHPSHAEFIILRGEPAAVHDSGCDLRPFRVRQQPVSWRGSDRAVPYRLAVIRPEGRGERLRQEPAEPTEVSPAVRAVLRL